MQCLSCHNQMATISESRLFDHVTYDVCERCNGLWLDRGELDKLAFQTPGSIEASSVEIMHEENQKAPAYNAFAPKCLRCPDRTMVKMHFMGESRIMLDYCERCGGIWVDGGELTKINQHIQWFDNKAKPSKFGRFLKHAGETLFHRIRVSKP